jgi:NADH:ubiquinone reductase (H+-translocating)
VIGDLAHYAHQTGKPLPGIGAVAMQQGNYVAKLLKAQQIGQTLRLFEYSDAGSLAVIGRNKAVADLKFTQLSGFPAWFIWIFIHIFYLVEFDNKLVVITQWIWTYITRNQGARLITGKDVLPPIQTEIDPLADYSSNGTSHNTPDKTANTAISL